MFALSPALMTATSVPEFLLAAALWLAFWFVPLFGLAYLAYFLLSLPLRRAERGRFLLDLLEANLKEGRSVEQTLVEIARSKDPALGARFHLLAAHLENGRTFGQALAKVPRLLPPQIHAMVLVGEKIGDVGRILPGARLCLSDALSSTRSALNYLLILAFLAIPAVVIVPFLAVFIWPKWRQIFLDMEAPTAPLADFMMVHSQWIAAGMSVVTLTIYLGALCYIGGPRFIQWLELGFPPISHWIERIYPWRRKRILRDFAGMLAILLDAGVPEAKAVALAAESTANAAFVRRAQKAIAELESGVKLTEAVQRLDESSEFRWRLANAGHARAGFLTTLRGWLDWLDAKAFQEHQTAAQTVTTALVLFNGVLVGFVVVGVFQSLVAIIQVGVLW